MSGMKVRSFVVFTRLLDGERTKIFLFCQHCVMADHICRNGCKPSHLGLDCVHSENGGDALSKVCFLMWANLRCRALISAAFVDNPCNNFKLHVKTLSSAWDSCR